MEGQEENREEKERRETRRVWTGSGIVEGRREGSLYCFRGIPYAKASRFRAPQEYRWDGIWKADRFGQTAVQTACRQPGERENYGEDCLNLNLYVPCGALEDQKIHPESTAPQKLPAAVWLHGGAFQNGSSRDREGERMIRDHRFLFISVEYRLGALGYLYLGEVLGEEFRHTGNNGTLDQLAALKWIHENIEAFGGDPDSITVFGESAGAKSLGALLFLPEMKVYCGRVLMASGAWQSIRSRKTASRITQLFLEEGKKLGYLRKAEEILTLDVDKLLAIQERLVDNPGNTCMFGPVADGAVLPLDWQERLERGEYWLGRAMVGSCLHEMYFSGQQEDFPKKAPEMARFLFGDNARIAEGEFAAWKKERSRKEEVLTEEEKTGEWVRILSDYMYRTYSRRLAECLTKNGSRVWYYSFEYGVASHVLDQAMAFDNAAGDDSCFPGLEKKARKEMADMLYESFVQFFETGTPKSPSGVDRKPLGEEGKLLSFGERISCRPLKETETLDAFPQSVFRLEEEEMYRK